MTLACCLWQQCYLHMYYLDRVRFCGCPTKTKVSISACCLVQQCYLHICSLDCVQFRDHPAKTEVSISVCCLVQQCYLHICCLDGVQFYDYPAKTKVSINVMSLAAAAMLFVSCPGVYYYLTGMQRNRCVIVCGGAGMAWRQFLPPSLPPSLPSNSRHPHHAYPYPICHPVEGCHSQDPSSLIFGPAIS